MRRILLVAEKIEDCECLALTYSKASRKSPVRMFEIGRRYARSAVVVQRLTHLAGELHLAERFGEQPDPFVQAP